MATLSSLPVELLVTIFSDVAADFNTGHILTTVGRVCKLFHDVVQSSGIDVFRTSLRGIRNMQNFIRALRLRDMAQRRVHSLLVVVDWNSDELLGNAASDTFTLDVLQTILSTIDPSRLHTLFVYFPSSKGDDTPTLQTPVSLPALTNLHLSGLIAIPSSPATTFPHLKHVQLLRLASLTPDLQNVPLLVRNLAPNATHVKLSFLSFTGLTATTPIRYLNDLIATKMAQQMGYELSYDQDETPSNALPDTLARLVLRCPTYEPEEANFFNWIYSDALKSVAQRAMDLPLLAQPVVVVSITALNADREEQQRVEFVKDWMRVNMGEEEEEVWAVSPDPKRDVDAMENIFTPREFYVSCALR
ncbi:hypothetical protein EIP91_008045 [Steccherinum ochraceum]|uniref:Uncharacterized protein n=1 Tax=Steccherinum ochraceum TaxID=92696 RepID=A0A4R0RH95_9APHY|nr:hypothetical protein EIP91_008045 [Steccherinum ochraceum]